jgi:hypothetical protein
MKELELEDRTIRREFYFVVREFMTTFEKDPGKNKSFLHYEEFRGLNLKQSLDDATRYYWERLDGAQSGSYFLKFASPEDFEMGKNAAFGIRLMFVVVETTLTGEYEDSFDLLGGEDSERQEGLEIYHHWAKQLGYE